MSGSAKSQSFLWKLGSSDSNPINVQSWQHRLSHLRSICGSDSENCQETKAKGDLLPCPLKGVDIIAQVIHTLIYSLPCL